MNARQSKLCRELAQLPISEFFQRVFEIESREDRAVLLLQVLHPMKRVLIPDIRHENPKIAEDTLKALDGLGQASLRLNCIFEKHKGGRHE